MDINLITRRSIDDGQRNIEKTLSSLYKKFRFISSLVSKNLVSFFSESKIGKALQKKVVCLSQLLSRKEDHFAHKSHPRVMHPKAEEKKQDCSPVDGIGETKQLALASVVDRAVAVDALSSSIREQHIPHGRLTRLDDQMWAYSVPDGVDSSFEEIRINVPLPYKGKDAYAVAKAVASTFDEKISRLRETVLKTGLNIPIDAEDPAIRGSWHISISTPKGIVRRSLAAISDAVTQSIPFTRTFTDRKIVVVDASRVPEAKKISQVALPIITQSNPHAFGGTSAEVLSKNIKDRLVSESFQDPFTLLASTCFQKYESFFVMEAEHRGSYRFVIDDEGRIRLEENVSSSERYSDENRKVVSAYVEFLKQEYGASFVSYIEANYNISFEKMIREGLPLLPDHVSKCNIGVNNIEIGDVEHLTRKLQDLLSQLQGQAKDPSWEGRKDRPAIAFLSEDRTSLSMREARGLLRSIPKKEPTVNDLREYLTTLVENHLSTARQLPPFAFNALVAMIMPTDAELDRAFTGRKIRHLAIMGAHTMGEPHTSNPCRDLFELLHVFADCRKTNDWKNFYEILSHVVAKKSLFRKTPNGTNAWHVGLLIPGPNTPSGEALWYCNDAFYDDHKGNVNYILLPASKLYVDANGTLPPMIKLYRSTCSTRNAVNWQDSLAADLNPRSSPGSLEPNAASEYERVYIRERTIPVWMGYLIAARSHKDYDDRGTARLEKAAHEFLEYLKNEGFADLGLEKVIRKMLADGDFETLQKMLTQYGLYFKEDPRYKIFQDIAFVGHSLGGALAQYGAWGFLAGSGRVPLPGNSATCYSSDSPGIDAASDAAFMKFGRDHQDLLQGLNIRTRVIDLFEYGDFVQQAGECHLATTGFDAKKDASWLDFSAAVFRPIETTRVPSLVTPGSAHGRRIGLAKEGEDYTLTDVSPQNLWDFHHTLFLRGTLKQIFGSTLCLAPRATEAVRRGVSKSIRPLVRFFQWWEGNQLGARDETGVFAIDDGHTSARAII
jgi:hypothetical protein